MTHPSTRPRRAALAAVAALAGALLAAPPAAQAAATATSAPGTIGVYIGADHVVHLRTGMRAGLHRFVVRSARPASLQLVHPRRGYTPSMLAHDVNAAFGMNDLHALEHFEAHVIALGGVNSSPGHPAVLTTVLPTGRIWAVDTNGGPLTAGLVARSFTGAPTIPGTPGGTATITAIREHTWAPSPRVIARSGVLRFVNRSMDNHFVDIARLARGKTFADFRAWISKARSGVNPGPPPLDPTAEFSTGVVSPGHTMSSPYRLPAGHYVVACWWSDAAMGGMPHALMGMYRAITLR